MENKKLFATIYIIYGMFFFILILISKSFFEVLTYKCHIPEEVFKIDPFAYFLAILCLGIGLYILYKEHFSKVKLLVGYKSVEDENNNQVEK